MKQMQRSVLVLAMSLAACQSTAGASADDAGPTPAGQEYRVVHGWPLLPDGHMLGQATGVGVDSRDNVFVFHRAGREWTEPFPTSPIAVPTIAVFDGATGTPVASWGKDFFIMPHGLTIDGEDNVWVTDVGRHQVFKFTSDGKLLLAIGTNGVPGADATHFNLPTDVAVLPDGSFYVSDGYANSRVVKFSATGKFLFQWGSKGTGPGQFDLPHAIATDAVGNVYVADRSNARVQVFDPSGRFLSEWKDPRLGRPYSVAIGKTGDAFVVDGGDQPATPPDRSRAFRLSLDGKIRNTFGRFGNQDGQFRLAHDVAVASDGSVYVVDAWGMRVQKFVRQ